MERRASERAEAANMLALQGEEGEAPMINTAEMTAAEMEEFVLDLC
jgi:hypothetical protein